MCLVRAAAQALIHGLWWVVPSAALWGWVRESHALTVYRNKTVLLALMVKNDRIKKTSALYMEKSNVIIQMRTTPVSCLSSIMVSGLKTAPSAPKTTTGVQLVSLFQSSNTKSKNVVSGNYKIR